AWPEGIDERPHPPASNTPAPVLSDEHEAHAWLITETDNLLAVAYHAAAHQRPDHILHQSATLGRHLRARSLHHDAVLLHRQALGVAHLNGDREAEQEALHG